MEKCKLTGNECRIANLIKWQQAAFDFQSMCYDQIHYTDNPLEVDWLMSLAGASQTAMELTKRRLDTIDPCSGCVCPIPLPMDWETNPK